MFLGLPITTLAITNGPDFLLIGRAGRVCRIWFDRDQAEDSRVVPIVPDTAYTTGMTNRQTGSKDNNTDSPLVIASPFTGARVLERRWVSSLAESVGLPQVIRTALPAGGLPGHGAD